MSNARSFVHEPYDARCLHVAVTSLVRPIRRVEDTAESDAPEGTTVRLLHVRHQLPDVAVQADVLLRFQLLGETDEPRHENLEDAGHDLSLDTARSVTAGVVGRPDAARRTDHVPAVPAHSGSAYSGSAGSRGDHAGTEIRRVSALERHVGRLARQAFLIWDTGLLKRN